MFVAHENKIKKKFQKPNILRRTPKVSPKSNTPVCYESPDVKSLVTSLSSSVAGSNLQFDNILNVEDVHSPTNKTIKRLLLNNNIMNEDSKGSDLYQIDSNVNIQTGLAGGDHVLINNTGDVSQTTINVEAFLNSDSSSQNLSQLDIDEEVTSLTKQEWCLDFINNAQEIIIEDIDGSRLGSLRVASAAAASADSPTTMTTQPEQSAGATMSMQNFTLEYLANSTMNFKCDSPNCNKRFRSEQKLQKHRVVHNQGPKEVRHTTIECPVKKLVGKIEEPCGTFCSSKEELVKHLNEDHNPEDAMYICTQCGRRFFWASGLRAHTRAHCGPGAPHACAWPGCARVFRQPCRLREHMRAHTGDKPYPCRYPNCGWSFRTASKLVRHARRHTGERRHACAACGRAFRRREHLRDHSARHHYRNHVCTLTGCQKIFVNIEDMRVHMEEEHSQELIVTETAAEAGFGRPATTYPDTLQEEETFSVSQPELGGARSARTHCTWPLEPPPAPPAAPARDLPPYGAEEDVQVELSEGSESNIYTIRSDLFLHGNILNNEDSEQMPGVGTSSLLVVPQTDADLSLMDAHPNTDLMQEELMYTDSAVDESSFRVFLLSGEELT